MNNANENILHGRRKTKTDRKEEETQGHIAMKMKHEITLQQIRNMNTACKEETQIT